MKTLTTLSQKRTVASRIKKTFCVCLWGLYKQVFRRNIVLRKFTLSQCIREHANISLSHIESQQKLPLKIGVDSRRGNFLILADDNTGFTVATEDYVKGAVPYFRNKTNCLFALVITDMTCTCAESLFSRLINIQYASTGLVSPLIGM